MYIQYLIVRENAGTGDSSSLTNRKPHSQFVASNIVCSFSVFLAYHAKRETLHTSISTDSEMSLYRSRVVPRDYSINFCFAYDSKQIRQKTIFLRIPLTRSNFSKDVGTDSNFSEYLLIKRFHCWDCRNMLMHNFLILPES